MESARSLRRRAVMALLLMVGFYGFALAIAFGLLSVPYLEYRFLGRVQGQLLVIFIGGGLTILWALVPRPDKFEPPGPRLTPSNAPRLFTMIEDVAKATAQPRPEEVYLLSDVNAFVTHRGGFMGFGSRRVMGVGLPLVKTLTAPELRAVIAHEFGHYVSGDVALGPWIHKTRAAIGRTLQGLSSRQWLQQLFTWYGNMFMRMTTLVSREQEFVADATAARVAGAGPAIKALKRVEVIAPAYAAYVNNEVLPVLRAGFLPPVSEGFDLYLSDPDTHLRFQNYAKKQALDAEVGEFDSHPPMAERIAALERITPRPIEQDNEPAGPMLKDPDRHARALLEHNLGRDTLVKLKAIEWGEVGAKVYAGKWQETAKENAKWLGALTADQIPPDQKWFWTRGAELATQGGFVDPPGDFCAAIAVHVLMCAVGSALLRDGWTVETAPGRPIVVVRGDQRFDLQASIAGLADGSKRAEEWKAACVSLGIDGVTLGRT